MTTAELLKFHEEMSARTREVMSHKNHDYAGSNGDTPFANFECAEVIGIPTGKGMLLRMLDKIKRLQTFMDSGKLLVPNEGAQDACDDILNYAVLIAAWIKSKQS